MALNEKFAEFVIKLAIEDSYREAFEEDPELMMKSAGLTEKDKDALRSEKDTRVRTQLENIQVSGQFRKASRKSSPKARLLGGKKR